jgi:SET domain-containing protein
MSEKVEVRSSGIDRKGVFALEKILAGELISIWGGYIISFQELQDLANTSFPEIDNYAIEVADGFFIIGSKDGTLEDDDYFNHSCDPNAGMQGHLLFVALRDIQPGEEITYDYVMTDADFDDYSFDCHCGSPHCRKKVTTQDWKISALQRRYAGFFSHYVQSKIDSMGKQPS